MRFTQQLPAFLLLFSLCLLATHPLSIECLESQPSRSNRAEWKLESGVSDANHAVESADRITSNRLLNGLTGTRRRPQERSDLVVAASERRQVQVVRNANGEYVVVPVVPSFHTLYRGYSNRPNGSNSAISGLQAYRASQASRSSASNGPAASSVSSGSSSSSVIGAQTPNVESHSFGSPNSALPVSPNNRRRTTATELTANARDVAHASESLNEAPRVRNRVRVGMFQTSVADHLLDERPASVTSAPLIGSAAGSFISSNHNHAYNSVNRPQSYRSEPIPNSYAPEVNINRPVAFSESDSLPSQPYKIPRAGQAEPAPNRGSDSDSASPSLSAEVSPNVGNSFHRAILESNLRNGLSNSRTSVENRIRLEDASPRVRLEEAILRTRNEMSAPKSEYSSSNERTRLQTNLDNTRVPPVDTNSRQNWRENRPANRVEENAAIMYNKYETAYLDHDRETYSTDRRRTTSGSQSLSTHATPVATTEKPTTLIERSNFNEPNAATSIRHRVNNDPSSSGAVLQPMNGRIEPKSNANEFENAAFSKPDPSNKLPDYDDYSEPEAPRPVNERVVSNNRVAESNRNSNPIRSDSRDNYRDYSVDEERRSTPNLPSSRHHPTHHDHRQPVRSNANEEPIEREPAYSPDVGNNGGPTFGGRGRGRGRGRRRYRQRMRTSTTTTSTTTTTAAPLPHDYDDNYYDYEDYEYNQGDGHGSGGRGASSTTTTTTTTTVRPRFGGRRRGPRPGRNRHRPFGRFGQGRRHEYDGDPDDGNYSDSRSSATGSTTTSTTPASTTASPTTTTRKLSPNYKPRPDGRIIDYNSDPNFPYELKGADLTNYPFYISIPEKINFNCEGRHDGYYASIEHSCQIYHHCAIGYRYDFLCPNYTLFDQTTFTCRFVNTVDCEKSEKHFNRNEDLYVEKNETDSKRT